MTDPLGNDKEVPSSSRRTERQKKKNNSAGSKAAPSTGPGKKKQASNRETPSANPVQSDSSGEESGADESIDNTTAADKPETVDNQDSDDDEVEDTNVARNRMRVLKTADHVIDFKDVIEEINKMDFGVLNIDTRRLANALSKFVAVGSLIHKLTPDDLTIIANLKGKYPNKEEKNVTEIDGKKVPNTVQGLLANGTKFFDAIVYRGIEPERRPKPIEVQFDEAENGELEIPTYDDMSKLTTYIFVAYFFVVIRAHAPSDSGAYENQPMPHFIKNIMNCKASVSEVSDYLSSFDLTKLSPEWVKFIPTKSISQEAVNRLGLGVAGYRLVSVFNILKPDMYDGEEDPEEVYRYKEKPDYMDVAVEVMQSFKKAGYCWDFHPATRSPDIMSKYGNINKNAANLILECYKSKTIKKLLELKKLAVYPKFDFSHTEYRTWTSEMKYEATRKIFRKEEYEALQKA